MRAYGQLFKKNVSQRNILSGKRRRLSREGIGVKKIKEKT